MVDSREYKKLIREHGDEFVMRLALLTETYTEDGKKKCQDALYLLVTTLGEWTRAPV